MVAELLPVVVDILRGALRRDSTGLNAGEIEELRQVLGVEQTTVLDAFLASLRSGDAFSKDLLKRDFLERSFRDWVSKRKRFSEADLAGKSILKVSSSVVRVCRLAAGGSISESAPFGDGPAWNTGDWAVHPDGVLRVRVGRDPVWDMCVVGDPSGIHFGLEGSSRLAVAVCGAGKSRSRFLKVTDVPNARHLTLRSNGSAVESDPFEPRRTWQGRWSKQGSGLRLEMQADRLYVATFAQCPLPWSLAGPERGVAPGAEDSVNEVRLVEL